MSAHILSSRASGSHANNQARIFRIPALIKSLGTFQAQGQPGLIEELNGIVRLLSTQRLSKLLPRDELQRNTELRGQFVQCGNVFIEKATAIAQRIGIKDEALEILEENLLELTAAPVAAPAPVRPSKKPVASAMAVARV